MRFPFDRFGFPAAALLFVASFVLAYPPADNTALAAQLPATTLNHAARTAFAPILSVARPLPSADGSLEITTADASGETRLERLCACHADANARSNDGTCRAQKTSRSCLDRASNSCSWTCLN